VTTPLGTTRNRWPLAVAVALALFAGGCAGTGSDSDVSAGELSVTDARSRMSSMFTGVGAVFLDISNGTDSDDRLVGATVDPSIAAEVELHETFDADQDSMDDGGMAEPDADNGGMGDAGEGGMGDTAPPSDQGFAMMGMRQIDALPLLAGETVSLEPGGYHLMLLELAEDLVPGQEFDLTLEFEVGGPRTVTVTVRDDV
jgi:periplasmic copper chaperone A